MRHSRFVRDVELQLAEAQAPARQPGVPRTLEVADPPQAVVVCAHDQAVTLEVGAESARRPDDRQALVFRDSVGELVRGQTLADLRDGLELAVVLLLEQGGTHLRSGRAHVEDVLAPASRECENRRGLKGLFKPVERLLLQRRGGGHEDTGRGPHKVR